ncbi:type VII secretion system-associated protein [Streptomyces zhihengii]|uniref:type VII secretion system-associated protein n=1 Tax=Streptomyces zhihengii TaxID=1818004 RepID=UPI00339F299F
MPNLTTLDPVALLSFVDNELGEFRTSLLNERTSNDARQSLYDLANSPMPLTLGLLAGDDELGGKKLVTNTVNAGKAVDEVFNRHIRIVDDLDTALRRTVELMRKAQHDSLTDIEGRRLLQTLSSVETLMNGGGQDPAGKTPS